MNSERRSRTGFVAAAGDLLLGSNCLGCGRAWWGVCPTCRAELDARPARVASPDPLPSGFPYTIASSPYDDLASALILAHKEDSALTLTPLLGTRLALAVAVLLADLEVPAETAILLVPVPSARAAVRRRGLDASLAMARAASRRLRRQGRPVQAAHRLRQRGTVRDQRGLDAASRLVNLRGGLVPTRRAGRDRAAVVLVDDVVTTGASLTEATRSLRGAGVAMLGAATVAATVLRRSRGGGAD